ncbi:MAG: hypothetical protein ACHQF2_05415, partial [Flavobacteriales bacterium]
MKKLLLSAASLLIMNVSFGSVHVIINIGTTDFNPDPVSAVGGDTLVFNLMTGHTATSVSQTTWNANGNTPNGAFNFPAPGGTYIIPGAF